MLKQSTVGKITSYFGQQYLTFSLVWVILPVETR